MTDGAAVSEAPEDSSAPSRKRQRARKPAADEPAAAEEGEQEDEQEGEPGEAPNRVLERAVKNRLSAARSRQRRLAYTAELETIVAALREENEQLKAEVVRLTQGRS